MNVAYYLAIENNFNSLLSSEFATRLIKRFCFCLFKYITNQINSWVEKCRKLSNFCLQIMY